MSELTIKLENLQATLTDPVSNEDILAAWSMVDEIIGDVRQLEAYCDKLVEGLPEGMLPKDIELLRSSNAAMATKIVQLENVLRDAKIDIDRAIFHEDGLDGIEGYNTLKKIEAVLGDE